MFLGKILKNKEKTETLIKRLETYVFTLYKAIGNIFPFVYVKKCNMLPGILSVNL